MSVSTGHVLHGINFASPAALITQLTDASPEMSTELMSSYAAGHPHPLFRSIVSQKPSINFSTPQLKTILDVCGLEGVDLSSGNTDLYYRKLKDLGARESTAGTVHTRFRMAQGLLYWTGFTLPHEGQASIDCRILPTWDGTNAPLVPAGSLAVVGTPAADEEWTIGKVVINGTQLVGCKEASYNSGWQLIEESSDGEPFTTFAGLQQTDPVWTIRSLELGAWATFGTGGTAVTSWAIYGRKKAKHGTNTADASAVHLAFTGTSGFIYPESTSGGGRQNQTPAVTGLRLCLTAANSSTAPMAIATTSAIP